MDLRISLFFKMISESKKIRLILILAIPTILASIAISYPLTKANTAIRKIKTLEFGQTLISYIALFITDTLLSLLTCILQYFYIFYSETFIAHWLYQQIYLSESIKQAPDSLYTDFLLKKDSFVNMTSLIIFSIPCNLVRVIIRFYYFNQDLSIISVSVFLVICTYFICSYFAIRSRKAMRHTYNTKRIKKNLFCQLSFENYEVHKADKTSDFYINEFTAFAKDAASSEFSFMMHSESYRLMTRLSFVVLKVVFFGIKMFHFEIPLANLLSSIDDLVITLLCLRNDSFMFFEYFFEAALSESKLKTIGSRKFKFDDTITLTPTKFNKLNIFNHRTIETDNSKDIICDHANIGNSAGSKHWNTPVENSCLDSHRIKCNGEIGLKFKASNLHVTVQNEADYDTKNFLENFHYKKQDIKNLYSCNTKEYSSSSNSSLSEAKDSDISGGLKSDNHGSLSHFSNGSNKETESFSDVSDDKNIKHSSSGNLIDIARLPVDQLVIPKGKKVFIWSKSSNGKTELLEHLLNMNNKYWDVKVDDIALNSIDISSLKNNVSMCLQNQMIFNQSIAFNLAYGTSFSQDEILKILAKYEIASFFKQFPDGLETKIGNDGIILSNGQRQLIHFYRTIIKEADLYLFDEPAVFLDIKKQQHVFDTIHSLPSTVVVVSKNYSFSSRFDLVYELE